MRDSRTAASPAPSVPPAQVAEPLIDRAMEIARVVEAANASAPVWLALRVVGAPGVGKDAFLRAVGGQLAADGCGVVALRREDLTSPATAFLRLVREADMWARESGRPLAWPALAPEVALTEVPGREGGLEYHLLRPPTTATGWGTALTLLLQRLVVRLRAERRRLVVLIHDLDAFREVAPFGSGAPPVEAARRGDGPAPLVLLAAATRADEVPWVSRTVRLGAVEITALAHAMRDRALSAGAELRGPEADEVVESAGGRPAIAALLCDLAVAAARRQDRQAIAAIDVADAVARLDDAATPSLMAIWRMLTPVQRQTLRLVAATGGLGVYRAEACRSFGLMPAEVQAGLEALATKDLVYREVEGRVGGRRGPAAAGAWVIADPTLARWVTRP